ncbi:PREDICTED: WEB family protein At4g27595, chloroplastic-like [Amphimedon queenslandica]|nr:PREDICTED: WEB family protein At4g27595, chloroplastic-like [Amphimedon queenslandica]|eukprot:XP_003390574.2 PREDICTED: WEB family protein At4g27595, chloroplastic-like [Amphimedon queenslandica]
MSLQSNLLNLKEVLIHLTSRQMQLFSNLSKTNTELVETVEEVDIFANFIKEIEMSAKLLRQKREMNDELINNITEQLSLIETLLKVNATQHLKTSLNITKRIDIVISQLANISMEAEAAANEQSVTVRELLRNGLALSDNTTDLLQSINELVDIENSTLDLLRGLNDCSTSNLSSLVAEGEIKLNQVINDTVEVLEAAMSVYDDVENIEFIERGRELLAQSLQLVMIASRTYNETVNVSIASNEVREAFNVLFNDGQDLLSTASYLNNTAQEILAREKEALSSANASLREGERIIKEAEEVLKRVKEELARALSYVERLHRLRLLVEEAEEDSNMTLSLAIERRSRVNELSNIILATESILLGTIETLDIINDVLNSTNATALISRSEATKLQEDLRDIQLEETERKLRELGERGEKERQSLLKASTGLNAAIANAARTNDSIAALSVQVEQVEERINSISFADSATLDSLDRALSNAEAACNATGMELEELKSEISVLESMSENLKDKYVNLQLHRDLLKDMRDNLDTLDCENEFQ